MPQQTEGALAPDFTLPTGEGKDLSLKSLRGKKVVLYFYPRDNTSGCTKEACSFQENLDRIRKAGAVVIGVSPDTSASHLRFAEKYNLTFPLISDEKKTLAKLYGVWKKKSFMGKTYLGVVRSTFVIDEKGRIMKIFNNVRVNGHTEEVLEVLEEN
ncbi:MAG: thioredoxin-dependent thiol peroxidase [Ignavibacteria bacterium]|nr:thioredoxin-dependent thiol peroxidase [Ignavibacteria bacterium]